MVQLEKKELFLKMRNMIYLRMLTSGLKKKIDMVDDKVSNLEYRIEEIFRIVKR